MSMPGLDWLRSKLQLHHAGSGENLEHSDPRPTNRLRIVARLLLFWFVVIFLRLVQLQIVRHDDFQQLALQQHEATVEINAPRGTIFDRNGQPLAMSLPIDSICVNPLKIPDPNLAADLLSTVLSLDREELLGRLMLYRNSQKQFLWVKRKITPEESTRLRSYRLDWVEFRTESHRFYPKEELAAHVVGSVDHQEHGTIGLERSFEEDLQGRPGTMRVVRDSKQRGFETVVSTEPVAGINITTTIDERIQHVVERELKKAVTENNCKTGSVVVMNPQTGEILSMASYPTFNPNEPMKPGENQAPRLNLAVSGPFEPGSVFKVITVSAALECTRLRPETIVNCGNGVINLFGRVIHDHDPYSALSVADVLAKSSNIGAINIGLKVGDESMLDYVLRFGFGKQTGIQLPAEEPGLVRKLKVWSKSSIGSVAMGHELSTTTVQLAQACSVVANGGLLVRPKITMNAKPGRDRIEIRNEEKPKQVLKPETAITMRQLMEGVVLAGTGKKAQLNGYSSGGKTGSAQIFDFETKAYTHRYNASFMGFAPVTNPAVVIVVTLNGAAKYGGAVAAPVFKEIATAALRILDVPRDLPENMKPRIQEEVETVNDLSIAELSPQPVIEPEPLAPTQALPVLAQLIGPKVPNFQGMTMRAVLQTTSSQGLPVEILGSGIARTQIPAPGAVLPPGERIRIQFVR